MGKSFFFLCASFDCSLLTMLLLCIQDAGAFFPSSAAQNVVDGHREVTHEVLWRLLLHFQVRALHCDHLPGDSKTWTNTAQLSHTQISPLLAQVNVSVSVGRLAAEIALVKRRSDYSKNSSLRRASDAQMYINAPNISALLQWCRAVGLCHGVQVRSVISHKLLTSTFKRSP